MGDLLPALVAAVLCGAGGLAVPALIGWIPEPEEPAEDKETYAAIAARSDLRWKAALASLVAGGLIGWELGWAWPLVYLVPLVPVAVALAVVDWRTLLLPTKVIRPAYLLVIVGVLVCWVATRDTDDLIRAGWGLLLSFGLFWLMWRVYSRGMGYGDVRLSGMLGIALGQLGWGELLVGVYSGFVLGGVLGTVLSVSRIVDRKGYPFGPFMVVGALVGILWGDSIISALLGDAGA